MPHTESSTVWRAANAARFPVLALEGKRYLSTPPTSVASERLFSLAAQACADDRCSGLVSRLHLQHIKKWTLCHVGVENQAMSKSMIKQLTTVNRCRPPRQHSLLKSWMECCILPSVRSLIIGRPVARLKRKNAAAPSSGAITWLAPPRHIQRGN